MTDSTWTPPADPHQIAIDALPTGELRDFVQQRHNANTLVSGIRFCDCQVYLVTGGDRPQPANVMTIDDARSLRVGDTIEWTTVTYSIRRGQYGTRRHAFRITRECVDSGTPGSVARVPATVHVAPRGTVYVWATGYRVKQSGASYGGETFCSVRLEEITRIVRAGERVTC